MGGEQSGENAPQDPEIVLSPLESHTHKITLDPFLTLRPGVRPWCAEGFHVKEKTRRGLRCWRPNRKPPSRLRNRECFLRQGSERLSRKGEAENGRSWGEEVPLVTRERVRASRRAAEQEETFVP